MGAAILVVGVAVLSLSGITLASCLRIQSFAAFGLAAYVIAWTVAVATSYTLSIGASYDRTSLLIALVAVSGGSIALWMALGRPLPGLRPWLRTADDILRDPVLLMLVAAGAVAYAYTCIVSLATAPNDGDPLAYELTRAAFWRQQHGVGAIHAAYDSRLDQSPPHAEMGQLWTMVLSGSDRFVALGQFTAVLALTLGVAGVARRLGLPPRQAAYGALLVPFFPVVLVQSWTGFTDIVFAAFLVAAVYFALGSSQVELLPFGLAVGLTLGTKFLGPLLLPLVALMVIVAQPLHRLGWFALAGAAGGAFGGVWYVTNALRASENLGGVDTTGVQALGNDTVLGSLNRYVVELFDVSGAIGSDRRLYAIVGLLLVLAALGARLTERPTTRWLVGAGLGVALVAMIAVAAYGSSAWVSAQATLASDRRFYAIAGFLLVLAALGGRLTAKPTAWWLIAAGLIVALLPSVVVAAHGSSAWVSAGAWDARGSPALAEWFRDHQVQTASDGALSWFGPLGALVVLATGPLSAWFVVRGVLRRPALVAGIAPLLAFAIISLTIVYFPYQGRYFMSSVALASATWGAVARWRPMRYGVAAVAVVTGALCLANSLGKPSGLELLRGDARPGIWGMPRWKQQGILRPTEPERDEINTLRYVEDNVPLDSAIGIALVGNSFGFPYFGPHLTRHVVVVDEGDTIPTTITWLVTSPGKAPLGCPAAWMPRRIGPFGWGVWERTGPDSRCAAPTALVAPRPS